jgi:hypothetical protein
MIPAKVFTKRRLLLAICFVGFMVGFSLSGTFHAWYIRAAATIVWDGSSDGDGDGVSWSDPLNWNEDRVPEAIDDVLIDSNVTVQLASNTVTVNSLTLGKFDASAASVLEFIYDAIS